MQFKLCQTLLAVITTPDILWSWVDITTISAQGKDGDLRSLCYCMDKHSLNHAKCYWLSLRDPCYSTPLRWPYKWLAVLQLTRFKMSMNRSTCIKILAAKVKGCDFAILQYNRETDWLEL